MSCISMLIGHTNHWKRWFWFCSGFMNKGLLLEMAHLLCMCLRQKVWVLWSFCKYTLQNLPRLRCLPVCSWLMQKWFPDKVNAQLIAPSLDIQFNYYLANIRLSLTLSRILADVVMQTVDWWRANKINTVFYVLLIQGQVDLDEVFI